MRSDLILSARIESIIWEALAENDLHMRLSVREKLAAELVALVRDQQTEAWEEGHEAAAIRIPEGVWHDTASPRPTNPYPKGQDR